MTHCNTHSHIYSHTHLHPHPHTSQIDNDGLHDLNVQANWQQMGETYWVRYANCELLKGTETTGATTFKPGDKVKVKRSVSKPKYVTVIYFLLSMWNMGLVIRQVAEFFYLHICFPSSSPSFSIPLLHPFLFCVSPLFLPSSPFSSSLSLLPSYSSICSSSLFFLPLLSSSLFFHLILPFHLTPSLPSSSFSLPLLSPSSPSFPPSFSPSFSPSFPPSHHRYNWGSVSHRSIGVVKSIHSNGTCVVVDFPEQNKWTGLISEMEIVPGIHPRHGLV